MPAAHYADARSLKQHLQHLLNISRFRQRLIHGGAASTFFLGCFFIISISMSIIMIMIMIITVILCISFLFI